MIQKIALFIFVSIGLHAQNSAKISGTVLNVQNQIISNLKVQLFQNNSTLKSQQETNLKGEFVFDNLEIGNYSIIIPSEKYGEYQSELLFITKEQLSIILKPIILDIKSNQLDAVTINKTKTAFERKIDKTVVNVDALIGAAGLNAFEMLSKSPGVTVNQNGEIKLNGRSDVQIFIDDKPTYLSGVELENYLKSIPSSNVKTIELMSNPPSKFDAAGNGGIINLRIKRTKEGGLTGGISANANQGKYFRSNNGLSLNYNTKKISVFTNLNYTYHNSFQDLFINRITLDNNGNTVSSFNQNSYIKQQKKSNDIRLGLDYYSTNKTIVGAVIKFLKNPNEAVVDNTSKISDNNKILQNTIQADNLTKGTFQNATYNLNFRHQIDTLGQNITADIDYLQYKNKSKQNFKNTIFDSNNNFQSIDFLNGNIPLDIKIYTAKTDYNLTLKNKTNFSAGLKSSFIKTNNTAEYLATINGIISPNYDLSNAFLYDENINAGYINYNKTFKRIGIQLGLRVENTHSKGNQLGNPLKPSSKFSRDYTNMFPTVFVSYQLDSIPNHQLAFSYGKRIDRPFYKDLNPFISPLDKFTLYSGNPLLRPTFSNNFSISHTYKNKFTSTFEYGLISDGINETLEIVNGIYYSRPGNISNAKTYTLTFNGNFNLKKWLVFGFNSEFGRQEFKSKLYNQKLDVVGNYCFLSATYNFIFNKGWSGEVSSEYTSNFTQAQLKMGDFGFGNLGIKKKILKDKGNLKLNFNDVFYTRKFRGVINNLEKTLANYNSIIDSRSISLTFNYQFGTSTIKRQKYQNTGADSESKRVKS